jgi:hypothetical protein
MNNRFRVVPLLLFAIGCLTSQSFAQRAADLAGRWTLILNTTEQDGKAGDNLVQIREAY